jgi:hypothetical protein
MESLFSAVIAVGVVDSINILHVHMVRQLKANLLPSMDSLFFNVILFCTQNKVLIFDVTPVSKGP